MADDCCGNDQKTGIWEMIQEKLREHGVDLNVCCDTEEEGGTKRVKVVCVAPDLKSSVEELGQHPRDNVVMVRVDGATARTLDAWVETGAVKSRSEAAALFIQEGLKMREAELEQLEGALRDVEKAKDRLRDQARKVFGDENGGQEDESA